MIWAIREDCTFGDDNFCAAADALSGCSRRIEVMQMEAGLPALPSHDNKDSTMGYTTNTGLTDAT